MKPTCTRSGKPIEDHGWCTDCHLTPRGEPTCANCHPNPCGKPYSEVLPDRWEPADVDLDFIEPPSLAVQHERGLQIVVWDDLDGEKRRKVAFYDEEATPIEDVLSMLSWLEARAP